MFRVDVSRSLTDLAFRFVVPANRQVRWAVFESPTGEGSFRKKFEIERTVTAAAGLDFHSSGPIDVLLVGGYWYGLGYYVPDGHQANYTPSVGGFYSFGQAYGSLNKPFNAHSVEGDTSSFQSGAVVMRFTTAAP
jgi:hypothetical protein